MIASGEGKRCVISRHAVPVLREESHSRGKRAFPEGREPLPRNDEAKRCPPPPSEGRDLSQALGLVGRAGVLIIRPLGRHDLLRGRVADGRRATRWSTTEPSARAASPFPVRGRSVSSGKDQESRTEVVDATSGLTMSLGLSRSCCSPSDSREIFCLVLFGSVRFGKD